MNLNRLRRVSAGGKGSNEWCRSNATEGYYSRRFLVHKQTKGLQVGHSIPERIILRQRGIRELSGGLKGGDAISSVGQATVLGLWVAKGGKEERVVEGCSVGDAKTSRARGADEGMGRGRRSIFKVGGSNNAGRARAAPGSSCFFATQKVRIRYPSPPVPHSRTLPC